MQGTGCVIRDSRVRLGSPLHQASRAVWSGGSLSLFLSLSLSLLTPLQPPSEGPASLTDDVLLRHHARSLIVLPDLQLAVHLAPHAGVAPIQLAAVVAERSWDAVALSDVGAQYAGDHAAEVQQRHAAAPAVVAGRLALHAGEAEEATAAGAHVAAAVTHASAPGAWAASARHH